jgi:hypothetical protein
LGSLVVKYGFVHTDPTGAGALVVVLEVVEEVDVVELVVVGLVDVLLVLVCVDVGDVVGDAVVDVVVVVVDGCGVVVNVRSAPKAVPAELLATSR